MTEMGKSVSLKIDYSMKDILEEQQIKIVDTIGYEQPILHNELGYKYLTKLEIPVVGKEPIKANLVHSNTDQSFYDAFYQQLVSEWRNFALKAKANIRNDYTLRDYRDVSKKLGQTAGELYAVLYDKTKRCTIFEFIKNQKLKTPVQLEIDMVKLKKDPFLQGNDRRYLKTYIDGRDVTAMVANAIDKKVSVGRNTFGTLMINGCGMDMFLAVQRQLHQRAERYGYHNMIDPYTYKNKFYENKAKKSLKPKPLKDYDLGR